MRIFDIPPILEAIRNDLASNCTPDPAKVNILVQQGPQAIESWIDCIEEIKAEAAFIKDRIAQLQERMQARLDTAERMAENLSGILDSSFNGKIKTPTLTVWNQDTTSYDFDVPEGEKKYWVTPAPRVDKKALLNDLRDGKLPPGIEVRKNITRSIRTRR